MNKSFILTDETALSAVVDCALPYCRPGQLIFLEGELGAGKTSCVRALLRRLGIQGPIRSPSFSVVESYPWQQHDIHHFDFYRFHQGIDVDHIGFADYLSEESLCFIEWPDRVASHLPKPQLRIVLELCDDLAHRRVVLRD